MALRRSCPRRAWSWSRPPPPRRSPPRTSRPLSWPRPRQTQTHDDGKSSRQTVRPE